MKRLSPALSLRLQLCERAFLVCAHKTAIPRDLRREDGSHSAIYLLSNLIPYPK